MLCVLNLGEDDAARMHEVEEEYRNGPFAGRAHTAVTAICGKIEAELAELSAGRSAGISGELRAEGIRPGAPDLGDLRVARPDEFLTAGETEVRAWTIPMNSTAQKAAGAIHSDFEKKFIRAEVVNWKTLIDLGGYPGVREKGLLRLEGKEYIVKDGDVLVIRHG